VVGTIGSGSPDRRDRPTHAIIQKGKFPFTPGVMSWISVQLDKPSSAIQATDVEALAKKA